MSLLSHNTKNTMAVDVVLGNVEPIAQGRSRNVYLFRKHSLYLVKMQKTDPAPRWFFRNCKLLQAIRRRYKQVIPLQREIREYVRASTEGDVTFRHMQRFVGVVIPPLGNGLIVEAVRCKDGTLAKTLREVITSGQYDAAAHAALQDFLHWFVSSKVVAADVHLDNIVFNEEDNTMVLIDGIGDKTFLPLQTWFPWLNRVSKKRLAKSIYEQTNRYFMEVVMHKNLLALIFLLGGVFLGIDIQDGRLMDG